MSVWPIFRGTQKPHPDISGLPDPPPWRQFGPRRKEERGGEYQANPKEIQLVNAALFLRRPLLVTGKPGTGKTSLAYAVAHELQIGPVFRWSVTSRSTLADGLYRYDAIGRMQEQQLYPEQAADIGNYLRLGPLGTALLPSATPRVLLIDELDKSDIDLPNDLLNIFEEGEFEIPELARLKNDKVAIRQHASDHRVEIMRGHVQCSAFPFVVITSNGEREFAPPFLRRCIRLDIDPPDPEKLKRIVLEHLGQDVLEKAGPLIDDFLIRRRSGDIATDQLLNAITLPDLSDEVKNAVLRPIGSSDLSS
jgi:MoxR-like ATPase